MGCESTSDNITSTPISSNEYNEIIARDSLYKVAHPNPSSCMTKSGEVNSYCITMYFEQEIIDQMGTKDFNACSPSYRPLGGIECPIYNNPIQCSLNLHGMIYFYTFYGDSVTIDNMDWCENF